MRRHPRSDCGRRIGRKLGGGGAAAAPEIGSRVFPLPAPTPASMPSVGTRRSTRVFVPKSKASGAGTGREAAASTATRVLRSGKRFALSKPLSKRGVEEEGEEDKWRRLFGVCGDLRWCRGGGDRQEVPGVLDGWPQPAQLESDALVHMADARTDSSEARSFGAVYSRKRSRPKADGGISLSSSTEDGESKIEKRLGIVFARKQPRKRPKVAPLLKDASGQTGITEAAQPCNIADEKVGDWQLRIPESKNEKRFGIVFVRKQLRKRPKVAPLLKEASGQTGITEAQPCNIADEKVGGWQLRIPDSARNLASEVGISGDDLSTSVKGSVILAVLVESTRSGSSLRFAQFLLSLLRWMRSSRTRIWELVTFLMSGSTASTYSLHGIHFLPLMHKKENVMLTSSLGSRGFCKIYGARKFVPVISLDFSSLPSYFTSLHNAIHLGSRYLSIMHLVGDRESGSLMQAEATSSVGAELVFGIPAAKGKESCTLKEVRTSLTQNACIAHGSRLQKHQKKRSSSRHSRGRPPSLPMLHAGAKSPNHVSAGSPLVVKSSSTSEHLVKPTKFLDVFPGYFLVDDSGVLSPIGLHEKQRRSALKSPVERTNEKLALAEVKQNIDSVHCKANILVTLADRCRREEGAEVMLELSDSSGWFIAVKSQGTMRIAHRPQDLKPCVVNRYTHAYMWALDDGTKLEFLERWDWLLFKELHVECQIRNSQVKIIPVPGVQEVSDYVDIVTTPFVHPNEYIRMPEDEIGRALARDDSLYEMDSGDEKWLSEHNSNVAVVKSNDVSFMSEDEFEKMMTMFEKDAYNNPEEIGDFESLLNRCQETGKGDGVVALYDYWKRKRNKRGTALVRFFQGTPLRRAQKLIPKPFLRKKRSLKRQRSQARGGKPEALLQDWTEEDALRRVQEAEAAANRAVKSAIHLRSRAQMLMANADLATYKSVMAARITEAIRASDDSDLASSILH